MTTPDTQWENGMFYRKVAPRFPNSSKSLLSKAHYEARNEVNHQLDEIAKALGCKVEKEADK